MTSKSSLTTSTLPCGCTITCEIIPKNKNKKISNFKVRLDWCTMHQNAERTLKELEQLKSSLSYYTNQYNISTS